MRTVTLMERPSPLTTVKHPNPAVPSLISQGIGLVPFGSWVREKAASRRPRFATGGAVLGPNRQLLEQFFDTAIHRRSAGPPDALLLVNRQGNAMYIPAQGG